MILSASTSLLAQALGWAVLHSLWQIALIWVVFKALSWVLRGRNQAIYLIALLGMLAAATWFFATVASEFSWLKASVAETAVQQAHTQALPAVGLEPVGGVAANIGFLENTAVWLEANAVLVGWAWGACVVLLWLRLIGGWWMLKSLQRRDVRQPLDTFEAQCLALSRKLNIKPLVKLLESPHVQEPLTLGFWKPIILFPAGMLLALSPAQVEALLLHELAHIRRHDYLVNLVQIALETCFFYHPMFWMLSRDARARREFCCDDVVMAHTSDRLLYAKTLTDLQLSLIQPGAQFTMNATGKGRFTERILRIAGINPKRENRPNWLIILLLPAVIALGTMWTSQASPSVPAQTMTVPSDITSDTLPPQKVVPPAKRVPKDPPIALEKEAPLPPATLAANDPDVAIQVSKMNVFYMGVDNPLRIAASGIPNSELSVQLIGAGTIDGGNGEYSVRVTEPGEVTVRVMRREGGEIKFVNDQKYRVKPVPDPSPELSGRYSGGTLSKAEMLTKKNMLAMLVNFDFDAVCSVLGYQVTILPKGQDPVNFDVIGSGFPANLVAAIENLSGDGDAIFFDDIQAKCSGDTSPRHIGGFACMLRPPK